MKTFKEYENKLDEIDSICENMKYDDLVVEEAEHEGKKVKLNNPTRSSDGKKKFYVYYPCIDLLKYHHEGLRNKLYFQFYVILFFFQ